MADHAHVMEQKAAWPDKVWQLGHRPDGDQMIMLRDGTPEPLHRDEDYGFVGNVITMTHQPTAGVKHFLYYSYSGDFDGSPISDALVPVASPQYLYPRENGATTPWSGTPQDIDDTQPTGNHDGDTTFMTITDPATTGIGTYHLFKKTPLLPIASGLAITSVTISAVARRVSGSSAEIKGYVVRIAGTTYTGTTVMASMTSPGTTYQVGTVVVATSPATASAWTPEEIEGMEFGVGIRADGAGVYRVTQIFLTVAYA